MHISVRHDIFYNFSSGVINFKNIDTFLVHPLTPFDLHLTFCTKWKVLQSYINLEDSGFGSNFREVIVAIIFNLFWVVFHGILPKCRPIYTKALPVMQLN